MLSKRIIIAHRNNSIDKETEKTVSYFQLITVKPIFWIHGLLFFISVQSHSKNTKLVIS